MSTLLDFSHPDRKSDAQFQQILDTFVGDNQTVLTGNLPDLLAGYEDDHNVKILEESDFHGVKHLCEQYPDLELGPTDLFGFLMAVLQRSTSPPYPTPESTPAPQHSTPQDDSRRRRRHSDRIRSPSDGSSSSSEEDAPHLRRQDSAPATSLTFPLSSTAPPPKGFSGPIRKKTLSDPNRSDSSMDSPLPPQRVRGRAAPPSAFTGGFARPNPASRRRRGSSSAPVDDDMKSPDLYNHRRASSRASSRAPSPQPWNTASRPPSRASSPMSPNDQLDHSSFHEAWHDRANSPDDMDNEAEIERKIVADADYDDEVDEEEERRDNLDRDVGGNDSLMPRLSRMATESTASLHTSHDHLRRLKKENNELLRKLKETEKSLAVQGAENERMVEDLQARLEEAQGEIAQRRKDEKDMRGKDRAQLIQISGFEADILSLQRSLENAKVNHANMQKMYNSQCDEAQRLRDMLRDRDAEIQELEEVTHTQAADEEKLSHEIQALEAEVKRLEGDISLARQAESHLQVQKQENLGLKETIDRMRFDLDEARAQAALAGNAGRGSNSATASSMGGTISRNLGDELGRRLVDVEKVGEEEDEDGFVETVVTTQRTRRVGGRRSPVPQHEGSSGTQQEPVYVEEGVREYVDAATATDSSLLETPISSPPAYTPEPPPINVDQVLSRAHPKTREHVRDLQEGVVDGEEEYQEVVGTVGVRCTVIEEEMRMRKMDKIKRGETLRRRTKRLPWVDNSTNGIYQYIFHGTTDVRDNFGRYTVFAVAVFAFGMIAGSHLAGPVAGLHPRDYRLFQQMNTLAGAAGIGEGFLPGHMLGVVDHGARLVAGRIPT
ncbi:hypothetical protein IAR50_005555 [Cryptococcus sp. DSM 104548]